MGSPQARQVNSDLVSSPCFFLSTPKGASIDINPAYKDVPFIQEKLAKLKNQLLAQRRSVKILEASDPQSELFFAARDWLGIFEKTWADVTGGQPCQ